MRLTPTDKRYILLLCTWFAVLLLFLALPVVAARAVGAKASETRTPTANAQWLLLHGHYKQAIKAFQRENARQGGKSLECYWGMAIAHWRLGHLKQTETACANTLRLAGANVRLQVMAHNLKGMAAQKLGAAGDPAQLEEAEKDYTAAYTLDKGDPNRAGILFDLGVTQLQAGKTPLGVATLKRYLAAEPQSSMALAANQMIAHPCLAARQPASNFSLKTLSGRTYTLSGLHGKIVLLDFWGAWCPQCRRSEPALSTLWRKFSGQPFMILGVSSDHTRAPWQSFIHQHHMDWPQYLDSDYLMQKLYGVDDFPTFILIDQYGFVLYRSSGYGPTLQSQLDAVISEALQNISLRHENVLLRKQLDANHLPQTPHQSVCTP